MINLYYNTGTYIYTCIIGSFWTNTTIRTKFPITLAGTTNITSF